MDVQKLHALIKISQDIRVLYVEDDQFARDTMLLVLEDIFPNITIAVDGKDGLDHFNNSEFDLILTDINMPNMSGMELIEEIRKSSSIPILILSASNEVEFVTQAEKFDINGYLLKPVDMPQLIDSLYDTLSNIQKI